MSPLHCEKTGSTQCFAIDTFNRWQQAYNEYQDACQKIYQLDDPDLIESSLKQAKRGHAPRINMHAHTVRINACRFCPYTSQASNL